ncbi:prolyl oligopeptidase family serine peptidase [Sphingobacterium sp. SRCM116780]|uniref:alpha/beta hydrolase family protein n=1 Tax=Sphingobacterium sp. SRCM116780 TaxID=2907623 RepID=UPI001F3CB40B|nr:prolyl oligopeptidase family serine peptidase [Sphingobacterium sp. SRCM116780]UIR56547.1 prolyl oligopeptidase family serine peptidase [Sphingobacterium sp. SRCM116780]
MDNSCSKKKTERIPIASFFSTPEKSSFKISPNGKFVAYIGMDNHCKNIFLLNLSNQDSSKQLTYQNDINVNSFIWGDNEEIIFSTEQTSNDSLRLSAVNIHTDAIQPLIKPVKAKFRWVQPARLYHDGIIVAINQRDSSTFDLYKLFVDGRKPEMIYQNPGNISSWFISNDGEVRLAMANDSVEESLMFRANDLEPFQQVLKNDFSSTIIPMGFVKNSTTNIYALSNIGRDKLSLVEYDLNQKREVQEIFSNKEVDLDQGGYSFYTNEMLYISYTIAKKRRHFFNKDIANIFNMISEKAKGSEFEIMNADSALNKIIVRTYTDTNPGAIYYFDRHDDELHKLTDNNPNLKERELSQTEFVKYQARDGKIITGFITYPLYEDRKNLPVVVLPHDGPNNREVWGFDHEAQFLANRGYVVFQMNYRGSTGFGKEFWSAGFKEWGGKIQDDITDGVKWLIKEGIADKDKIAIVGRGFGGYSALHAACFNSDMYACAVSYSGFTNLFTYFRNIPPYVKPYLQKYYQIIGNPVRESSMFKQISPVFHSNSVNIPVLIAQGGKDRFSSVTDANQFVQKLKNNNIPVQYILKEEEGRTFKKDENIIQYYQELEKFLDKYIGK